MSGALHINELAAAWLVNSTAFKDADTLQELSQYAPDTAWLVILRIIDLPESEMHFASLSEALKGLLIYHGEKFIDRIEWQAANSPRFKTCLGKLYSLPGTQIPQQLWKRLSLSAGVDIGPIAPHMQKLFEKIPGLSAMLYTTPFPSNRENIASITGQDIDRIAQNWVTYNMTFWAWEAVDRIIREEPPEYAYGIVKILFEKSSSDEQLCSIGAGPLEDLLGRSGEIIMRQIEEMAINDQRFRFCLSHVWPAGIPDDVWKRIVTARGNEPQRG